MTFEQQFSLHYDEIFPASEKDAAFVKVLLAGKKRLLDIGCGSGLKTAMLADAASGVRYQAIDVDPAMIEAAWRNHADKGIAFRCLDMRDIEKTFSPGSFDGVVCLGNTLAYLTDPVELLALFRQIRSVLDSPGVLVGQVLNYNRIIEERIESLPRIQTPNLVFTRDYEWRDGAMILKCVLTLGEGSYRKEIPLRPILKSALLSLLETAGFGLAECYGGFEDRPCERDSYHVVFRAMV